MLLQQYNFPVYTRLLFPLSLLLILILGVAGSFSHPSLFYQVASYDFILTLPLMYYFSIRKSSIPKITIIPFFILCIFLANIHLPDTEKGIIPTLLYFVLPVLEGGIVVGEIALVIFYSIKFSK